jgi:hypothetical protein
MISVCPANNGRRGDRSMAICPSPDEHGTHFCIDDLLLCDNVTQCPNGEDENPTLCMFHHLVRRVFDFIFLTEMYACTLRSVYMYYESCICCIPHMYNIVVA